MKSSLIFVFQSSLIAVLVDASCVGGSLINWSSRPWNGLILMNPNIFVSGSVLPFTWYFRVLWGFELLAICLVVSLVVRIIGGLLL